MAKIPVERKSDTRKWIWLLGVLLFVGLIWFALDAFDEDDLAERDLEDREERVEDRRGYATANDPDGDIMRLTVIADAPDRTALEGRSFQFSDLRVESVVGDKTFWVTPQDGVGRHLVYLDEEQTPATPTEGRYDVTAGQVVNIYGTVKRLEQASAKAWGLTEQEANGLGDDAIYLHADRLEILQR